MLTLDSLITDSDGNILATNHREGVTNYLSVDETAVSLKRASVVWKGRNELIPKIEHGLYAVAKFEKISRITFPLGDGNLIFVSLDSDTVRQNIGEGGEKQIIEHVLNILSKNTTKQ